MLVLPALLPVPIHHFLATCASNLHDFPLKKLDGVPTPPQPEKKVSSKVTKAQRRAQQMEFNKKLWEEAYVYT